MFALKLKKQMGCQTEYNNYREILNTFYLGTENSDISVLKLTEYCPLSS